MIDTAVILPMTSAGSPHFAGKSHQKPCAHPESGMLKWNSFMQREADGKRLVRQAAKRCCHDPQLTQRYIANAQACRILNNHLCAERGRPERACR